MERYKNTIGFVDLLFNLLIGFVFLFLLAFILMNPIAKKDVLDPKAEYLIILEWDSNSQSDIDVWIKDNSGNIVSFQNKDLALMSLDRDDLGKKNDFIENNGVIKEQRLINREVLSIKSKSKRTYLVTVHFYSNYGPSTAKNDEDVIVEFVQVNPYKILKVKKMHLDAPRQEKTVYEFHVEEDGSTSFVESEELIATTKDSWGKYNNGWGNMQNGTP